jgi:formate dehydrogenase
VAKVLCVLYDDPVDGYPKSHPRDDLPTVERYPGGQTLPTPKAIDFKPGALLGSVSGELGLRKYLESLGHTFVVTADKEGPNSVFERELPDADIVISQPFWPAYLTAERIARAKNLKLVITAGIGLMRIARTSLLISRRAVVTSRAEHVSSRDPWTIVLPKPVATGEPIYVRG